MKYHIGLDLGQASDYTALCVIEANNPIFQVRHLQRFSLGTPYPAIVEQVAGMVHNLSRSGYLPRRLRIGRYGVEDEDTRYTEFPALVIDATGVGRPVLDLFHNADLGPVAVTITGGNAATREGNHWHVPKRDLVAAVAVALQEHQLKISSQLPDSQTLLRELLAFKVKIDPGTAHDSYGSWREKDHDDLVLAVALALWNARRDPGETFTMDDLLDLESETPAFLRNSPQEIEAFTDGGEDDLW